MQYLTVPTVFERVLERKIRNLVSLDDMQFGFRPGRETTDAKLIVRHIQEKFLAQKKDLWMAFMVLEIEFNRVPQEVFCGGP